MSILVLPLPLPLLVLPLLVLSSCGLNVLVFESAIKALDECKIDILGTVFGWVHAISMVWSPYELAFTVTIWARN